VDRNAPDKEGRKEVTNSWGFLWLHVGVCVLFFVFSFFVRRVVWCVWGDTTKNTISRSRYFYIVLDSIGYC